MPTAKRLEAYLFTLAYLRDAGQTSIDGLCLMAAVGLVPESDLPEDPVKLALFVREFAGRVGGTPGMSELLG